MVCIDWRHFDWGIYFIAFPGSPCLVSLLVSGVCPSIRLLVLGARAHPFWVELGSALCLLMGLEWSFGCDYSTWTLLLLPVFSFLSLVWSYHPALFSFMLLSVFSGSQEGHMNQKEAFQADALDRWSSQLGWASESSTLVLKPRVPDPALWFLSSFWERISISLHI